jgi:hypothetical protein
VRARVGGAVEGLVEAIDLLRHVDVGEAVGIELLRYPELAQGKGLGQRITPGLDVFGRDVDAAVPDRVDLLLEAVMNLWRDRQSASS